MYRLVKYTKKIDLSNYDYVFKDFSDFYDITYYIKYPLFGVYGIAIITNQINDTLRFIDDEEKYFHLDITIMMEEAQIQKVSVMRPDVKSEQLAGAYDTWKRMIGERELLFDEYMTYKLYASIEHDTSSMVEALDLVKSEYPNGELITEERLNKLFVLNNIVYPRQVLLKFLNMERSRWKLLRMCQEQMDNGVIVGATVNNIKKLIEEKAVYFKTGIAHEQLKRVNTQNLIIADKVFCTNRYGLEDPFILYKLYENGKSVEDIKGGSNVSL